MEKWGEEGEGSIKIFRRNFLSPVSKKNVGGSFSASLISCIEKCQV